MIQYPAFHNPYRIYQIRLMIFWVFRISSDISKGHHTLKAISDDCLMGSSGLTFHLGKL